MLIKRGVILRGLQLQMRHVLITCQEVLDRYKKKFWVTSGLDGVHSAGSLHYYGFAIDIRIYHLGKWTNQVFQEIKERLRKQSKYYDVILHKTHIHIEYDIKRYNMDHGIEII